MGIGMYSVKYHPDVKNKDLPLIPQNIRERIKRAIEERLLADPLYFGDTLKKSLVGFRKFRVGDYRIIHKISGKQIIILLIGHRKDVYERNMRDI
jgi:mRNA interferase RelE/StbE